MSVLVKLKKNWQFKNVYEKGKYSADKYVVVYFVKNTLNTNIVGFSVSKKVGNSVVRNRTKRRMKEAYRFFSLRLKKGYDIVFTARAAASEADFNKISNSMKNSLERAKLFLNEKKE